MTVKLNRLGVEEWMAPYAGQALAVHTNGDVYVTGFSAVDFATVKFTAQGSNVWTRTFDFQERNDVSQAVAIDRAGDCYVVGRANFTCSPFSCLCSFFLLKYTPDGSALWTNRLPSSASQLYEVSVVKAMAVTATGDIVVAGNFYRGEDYSIYKIKADGAVAWYVSYQASVQGLTAMILDGAGYVYLAGRRGFPNVFYDTLKLSPEGELLWRTNYFDVIEGYHIANAIALDGATNVYVTGASPGPGTGNGWATIKYDTNGKQHWVRRYDGPAHGDDQATAIAVDPAGHVYVAGHSTNPEGGTDLTVIKYAELPTIQVLPNRHVLLQFFGVPGQNYRFQATTNLADWEDLATVVCDPSGIYRYADTNAPAFPQRFYRSASP
jgi:hypothetical protein